MYTVCTQRLDMVPATRHDLCSGITGNRLCLETGGREFGTDVASSIFFFKKPPKNNGYQTEARTAAKKI